MWKFYHVKTPYIDFLRKKDNKVLINKESEHQRPYFGIIISIDSIDYLVPICSKRGRFITNKPQYHRILDGTQLLAVAKFNNMIPVENDLITEIDFSLILDPKYKGLVQKEYQFIKSNWETIKGKAEKYLTIYNSNEFYRGISNNFSKLEIAMKEYPR